MSYPQRNIMLRVNNTTYKRIAALARKQAMETEKFRSLGALVKDAVIRYLEQEENK